MAIELGGPEAFEPNFVARSDHENGFAGHHG